MALLVENKCGKRSTVPKPFKKAEIALGWCRQNAVLLSIARSVISGPLMAH